MATWNDWIWDMIILESATPYSAEENIRRGKMAMDHVISSKKYEPRSMWRKELGWIGFEWGKAGEEPPEFASHAEFRKWQKSGRRPFDKGGYGVAHILAKRDWEGKYIEEFIGQKGIEVAYRIVTAIACGSISSRSMTAEIKWQGLGVYLRKRMSGGETFWLISGYSLPEYGYKYRPGTDR